MKLEEGIFFNIMPIGEDEEKEVQHQREEWQSFLSHHDEETKNEKWLWQYWISENRQKNQFIKNALSLFSSKIKLQKKLKRLVRMRSHFIFFSNNVATYSFHFFPFIYM
jgi:hypothetical protein